MDTVSATKVAIAERASEEPLSPRVAEALGELVGQAREGRKVLAWDVGQEDDVLREAQSLDSSLHLDVTGESRANAAGQDQASAVPKACSLQEGDRSQQGRDVLPGGQSAHVQDERYIEASTGSPGRRLGCTPGRAAG